MSKLIDKLSKLRQPEPQQIGFMTRSVPLAKPRLQVLAELDADNLEKFKEVLKTVDGLIVDTNKVDDLISIEKVCQANYPVAVGAWLKTNAAAILKKASVTESDFFVVPSNIPVTMTRKEKSGRILDIDVTLSEGTLRAAGELPLDAFIVTGKHLEMDMTINRLIFIQRLLLLVNKPVLVMIDNNLNSDELQSLWDIGVSGVVVEVADGKAAEKVAAISAMSEKLEMPAFRKKGKSSPILPRLQAEAPQPEQEEEEEEDE
jgi:hypothetical protein